MCWQMSYMRDTTLQAHSKLPIHLCKLLSLHTIFCSFSRLTAAAATSRYPHSMEEACTFGSVCTSTQPIRGEVSDPSNKSKYTHNAYSHFEKSSSQAIDVIYLLPIISEIVLKHLKSCTFSISSPSRTFRGVVQISQETKGSHMIQF